MKIFSTYFAKLKFFPMDMIPISICGKAPAWYDGIQYKKLAPKYGFFKQWQVTHDNDYYIEHFNSEVLSPLNPEEIVNELSRLSNGKDVVLICYEKPTDFCHRHLVAQWLDEHGIYCEELHY